MREDVCSKMAGDITVLDCYHGNGCIWNDISARHKVIVFGIEKEKGKGTGSIYGYAEKVIPSLNLGQFKIIDLDAYGSPYQALKQVFNNKTLKKGTFIFYTHIMTGMGVTHKEVLSYIGITQKMQKHCRTIFKSLSFIAFKEYIRQNGIEKNS
jgi:hypothetical protein